MRWSVLAAAVAAAVVGSLWAATLEQQAAQRRRALAAAAVDARALQAALADVRRALSAMASPGQAAVSWSRQATASLDLVRARLTSLAAAEGGAELRALGDRLDRLAEAERRVREHAVNGRSLAAGDVVFGDALPHLDAVETTVANALSSFADSTDRWSDLARDRQILAIAGALGLLGLAAILLAPLPDREPAPSTGAAVARAWATAAEDPASEPSTRPEASGPPRGHPPLPPAAPEGEALSDLIGLAGACDALARLADADRLPGVLDAARAPLDARGLAVWLVTRDRRSLQVVAAAGYDRRVVERFPVLPVDDSNPTSRAFATGRTATAPAAAGRPGAMAVPVHGTRGVTGVLAVELDGAHEADADLIARAQIVASQLAALLGLPPGADGNAPDVAVARGETA